jgi:hypothetical protein
MSGSQKAPALPEASSEPTPAPAGGQPARPEEVRPEASLSKAHTLKETGGRDGPDPTRYGDWEKNGRCIDF